MEAERREGGRERNIKHPDNSKFCLYWSMDDKIVSLLVKQH